MIAILERGIKRVAGTLRRKGKRVAGQDDNQVARPSKSAPRAIDSTGADGNSGNDGDAVVVAITRWPETQDENPEGASSRSALGARCRVRPPKILVLGVGVTATEKAVAGQEAFGAEVRRR